MPILRTRINHLADAIDSQLDGLSSVRLSSYLSRRIELCSIAFGLVGLTLWATLLFGTLSDDDDDEIFGRNYVSSEQPGAVIGPAEEVGGGGTDSRSVVCQFNQEHDDNNDAAEVSEMSCNRSRYPVANRPWFMTVTFSVS